MLSKSFLLLLHDNIYIYKYNAVGHSESTHVLDRFRAPPPWSPNKRSVTDNCHNIIWPIHWASVALHDAEKP